MNRKYSLKSSREIDRLVARKQSVGNKYYAVYYSLSHPAQELSPLIAVSVTKKVKSAVERNYLKKVTKEIIRPQLAALSGIKMLIVVKAAARELAFSQKAEQLNYLIKKFNKEKT